MHSELKPCPFCGGEEKHDKTCIVYIVESHTDFVWLYKDCPDFDYEKAWNQRAERTCKNLTDYVDGNFDCSVCGGYGGFMYDDDSICINYCPNCGAKVVE